MPISKIYAQAERWSARYHRGTMAFEVLQRKLVELGFYDVFRFGPNVVARYDGVRFEL